MDKLLIHSATWVDLRALRRVKKEKKVTSKDHILFDSFYVSLSKDTLVEIENRSVVVWGGWWMWHVAIKE